MKNKGCSLFLSGPLVLKAKSSEMTRPESNRDRWRHVTLKGQGRDPDMFGVHYLGNGSR